MKSLKVLVVDDDPSVAELLAKLLTENGHQVCGHELTEDGAFAAAASCRPGLVIIDAHLGKGSGISAMARMSVSKPADLLRAMALAVAAFS